MRPLSRSVAITAPTCGLTTRRGARCLLLTCGRPLTVSPLSPVRARVNVPGDLWGRGDASKRCRPMLSVRLRWGAGVTHAPSAGAGRRDSVAVQPLHRRCRSGDQSAGQVPGRRASVGARGLASSPARRTRQSGLLTQLRAYNDPVAVMCAPQGDAVLVVSRKHFGVLRLNW